MITIIILGCSTPNQEEYRGEVIACDYAFQVPSELPAGWNTFILNDEQAHEIHDLNFARIPEGITYSEYLTEYVGAWEILL